MAEQAADIATLKNVEIQNTTLDVNLVNSPLGLATDATLGELIAVYKAEDTPSLTGDLGLPILAMRQVADTTSTDADGDYTLLKIDEEGRLKVSSKPASYPDITGDITAVQATIGTPVAGGTVVGDVSRASNIMAFCTGIFAGVNVTFEGSIEASGDANWFGLQAVRTNANTIETATGVLAAQPIYGWELSVNALKRVRVRCTARTSGTQSWRFVQGTYATEPIPAAQVTGTQPVSGSVTLIPPTPTPLNFISAATTNLTAVKASAGTLYSINAVNLSASPRYLKLYNKASAPVVATDVPVMTIELPANLKTPTLLNFGAYGHRFAIGIALALTGAASDTDATITAVGEVKMLLDYI